MLSTLLERARKNDLIDSNPFTKVSFDIENDSTARAIFSPQGLRRFFDCLERGSVEWWIARVALYTGARLNEICQLTPTDIVTVEGVRCLRITDDDGKKVKNTSSVRDVPIHSQLLVDGVKDWMEGRKSIQGESTSAAISKRLNRLIKKALPTERNLVFHSFRHTFKSAARAAGISEDIHDRLTGHAPNTVARTYGTHSITSLKTAIDRIQFGIESE